MDNILFDIKFETEEMRLDRIIKEKLNSFPATPYDYTTSKN